MLHFCIHSAFSRQGLKHESAHALKEKATSMEQWKNPGCLGYIGDDTTQLYRDYNKAL